MLAAFSLCGKHLEINIFFFGLEMNALLLLIHGIRDLILQVAPVPLRKKRGFAFLVHPRDFSDVSRKYPFASRLSDSSLRWILSHLWPVVVSEVTGVRSRKTGKQIRGWIIAVPLTARQMFEDRNLSLKRIIQAAHLARTLGARIIGLGALTSSFSKGGTDVAEKVDIDVTTGHAYTAYNVTWFFFIIVEKLALRKDEVITAIVGAAGSVGSTSALMIARAGFQNFLLIDIARKKELVENLYEDLKKVNPAARIEISHEIGSVKKANFIITATNAPEVVIRSDHIKSGTVIIDDAQPSDVSKEVFDRNDVIVVEGGLVHTPGISSNFNFGFRDRNDNFCCLAEVLVLAAEEREGHYTLGRGASLQLVNEIAALGKEYGFRPAECQNFKEVIKEERFDSIKKYFAH
jgi:predicted amino acid dehydrogenase